MPLTLNFIPFLVITIPLNLLAKSIFFLQIIAKKRHDIGFSGNKKHQY